MKTFLFKTSLFTIISLLLVSFFGGAPAVVEAAPKPSKTPKPTKTTRPTHTPLFTLTPTLTATQTATATATNTLMPTFTATASPTSTSTLVPASLLAHWKFDEGSGSTVADSSGNGHTLFINDNASFGNIGPLWMPPAPTTLTNRYSLQFLPPYGRASTADNIDLANRSFSVAMWVARTPVDGHFSSDGGQMFFGHGTCYSTDCFGTYRTLLIGFRASGVFTCGFTGDDLDTSAVTLDGNWHHYVCSYDAVNHVRKAYKDGMLVGSDTPLGNYVGSGPVEIGQWGSMSSSGRSVGIVDEIRLYDAVISEAQVAALAERDPAYAPAPCTPHVLLMPDGGMKIPQLLQLWAIVDNGCEAPLEVDPWTFTPDPFIFTWACASDTSIECPNFLASANVPPNGNWMPVLNIQEFDIIQIWVTVCLVDHPTVCATTEHIYEGAAV